MNSVSLIGNLTRKPETKYSPGDNPLAICRFSIAINSGYGDNKRVDYPNIVVFGKTAENCEKFLDKGRKVAIEGRIQTGSYEKDGHKVYTTDIVANRVEFLGGGEKAETTGTNEPDPRVEGGVPNGYQAIDDDIPF